MDYDIYCDESRQDLLTSPASITATNRFCCIGGLMLTTESRAALKAKIKELRDKHSVYGELKWDGLPVKFYPEMFEHAFYKRTAKAWKAKKDSVNLDRYKRMPWINEVLHDPCNSASPGI